MCGLCHALGDDYGLPTRLLTSHEMVLLNILTTAQSRTPIQPVLRRCPLNPKRKVQTNQTSASQFSAAVAIELSQIHLADKLADGQGPSLWPKLGLWGLKGQQKKALTQLHKMHLATTNLLDLNQNQAQVELKAAQDATVPTANVSADLFAHTAQLAQNPHNGFALRAIGLAYGRYLYLADAYQDFAADMAQGQFNPLRHFASQSEDSYVLSLAGLNWLKEKFEDCQQEIQQNFSQLRLFRDVDLLYDLLITPLKRLQTELSHQVLRKSPLSFQKKKWRDRLVNMLFWPTALIFADCDCNCDCNACDCNGCGNGDGCCSCSPCDCRDTDSSCCHISCCDCRDIDSNCCHNSCCDCGACGDCGDCCDCCESGDDVVDESFTSSADKTEDEEEPLPNLPDVTLLWEQILAELSPNLSDHEASWLNQATVLGYQGRSLLLGLPQEAIPWLEGDWQTQINTSLSQI